MTLGLETEWYNSKRKKVSKYKQENKKASYKKQKETSDKVNKHTNNLYSAKIYHVYRVK